jgi:hypothetical protein
MTNRHKHLMLTLIQRRLAELDWSARQVDLIPVVTQIIDEEIMALHQIVRALTEAQPSGDNP